MDFAAPPSAAQRATWAEADRAARPQRLARLRERMASEGVDGYFGVRWEHMRYLTGLPFDESEVTGSGDSGKFLVGLEQVWVVADSRYTIAVKREAPESIGYAADRQLTDFWADLVAAYGHAGPTGGMPHLPHPVHALVLPIDVDNLVHQIRFLHRGRRQRPRQPFVERARGDRDIVLGQHGTDRLDPETVTVRCDVLADHLSLRSSSAWAKNADAVFKISFARRNSAFSWRSRRNSA